MRFIKILSHRLLATHEPKELEFLRNLTIIDSQENYYESLTSTLFSLDEQVGPDPILRVSGNVDHLFRLGYTDLIIGHNDNCLISTQTLMLKRYFKLNLLEYEYEIERAPVKEGSQAELYKIEQLNLN